MGETTGVIYKHPNKRDGGLVPQFLYPNRWGAMVRIWVRRVDTETERTSSFIKNISSAHGPATVQVDIVQVQRGQAFHGMSLARGRGGGRSSRGCTP
jgi:hypothetical protein